MGINIRIVNCLFIVMAGCSDQTAVPPGGGGSSGQGAGTPRSGGMSGSASGGSGGAGGRGNVDGAAGSGGAANPLDPLNAAARCSSAIFWTPADGDTRHMRPGEGCNRNGACHGAGAQLVWGVAGTVYSTGHEPDDCSGFDPTLAGPDLVHVVITDATGTEISLLPNDSGNFYVGSVALPAHVKMIGPNGKERAMVEPIATGDCNGCHSQAGSQGAPGRVTIPF